jgi:hypothetical protein
MIVLDEFLYICLARSPYGWLPRLAGCLSSQPTACSACVDLLVSKHAGGRIRILLLPRLKRMPASLGPPWPQAAWLPSGCLPEPSARPVLRPMFGRVVFMNNTVVSMRSSST